MTDKIPGFDVDEQPATFAEIDAWMRTEKGIAWALYASGCTSSAQPVAEPAKEVQPAISGERELPPMDEEYERIMAALPLPPPWEYTLAKGAECRERQLKAALAEIQQLKEVQPSVQFEEWWKAKVSSIHSEREKAVARAAWQAALAAQSVEIERLKKAAELHNDAAVEAWQLTRKWQKRVFELEAAQSAPVDWEKVVREKFPGAYVQTEDIEGRGYIWSGTTMTIFLGYSWQHAAHHPDVIGGGK